MADRRDSWQIMRDILKEARKGATKTRLVYRCNLNFKILHQYLNIALTQELIQPEEKTFKTTDKGKEYIQQFQNLSNMSPMLVAV